MASPKEVYDYAADLLEQKGWCKGVFAQDSRGNTCSEFSENAVCFCLRGAINRACDKLNTWDIQLYPRFHSVVSDNPYIWNDQVAKDKEQVIEVLHKMGDVEV